MRVLLSIRPDYVSKILDGTKKFEYRRRIFSRLDVTSVIVYCTKPIGKIVAEFDIRCVLKDSPEEIWRGTRHASGISREFFDCYFAGRETAYALSIGRIRRFPEPIFPQDVFVNFTPPQSYYYIFSEKLLSSSLLEAPKDDD